MSTHLDEILDEITREGHVDLPDRGHAGATYRLAVMPDANRHYFHPSIQYAASGSPEEGAAMCVLWSKTCAVKHQVEGMVRWNFSTLVSAIVAGLPVHRLRNGTFLPRDFDTASVYEVEEESATNVVERLSAVDLDLAVASFGISSLPADEVRTLYDRERDDTASDVEVSPEPRVRRRPVRRLPAEFTLSGDFGGGTATITFEDGQQIVGTITGIEIRTV